MKSLLANTINELVKTFSKKKTLALLLLTVLVPLGTAALLLLFKIKLDIRAVSGGNFPIFILGLFTNFFLPLFVFMWAADSFAAETGDKTLKLTLTRPISRIKVFSSKILAIGLVIETFLAVLLFASLAAGIFLGSVQNDWWGSILNSIKAYLVAGVPMLVIGILGAFIAQFFRNGSGALTTSIFVYIAAKLLPLVMPQSTNLLLVSYTDWHLLWLGAVPLQQLLYSFSFILSSAIIFFSAGLYAFISKEL